MSYSTKNYSTDGGDTLVIGGKLVIEEDATVEGLSGEGGSGAVAWDDIEDVPAPLTAAQAAGTPSIRAIGTSATTAAAGNHTFLEKFYAGDSEEMLARIGNLNAAVGEIEYETGPIVITSLGQARTKGSVVTASVEIAFATTPTTSLKVSGD